MKSITNLMSAILNLGTPLEQVIAVPTSNPAREIKRTDLGSLDVGPRGC